MATPQKSFMSLVGLSAVALSTAVIAAPASAEPVSRYVKYADLNLASAEGQKSLETRIDSAVRRICVVSGTRTLAERMAENKCKAAAKDAAMAKAKVTVANYDSNQRMASGTAVIVGN